jgi:MFS family permease
MTSTPTRESARRRTLQTLSAAQIVAGVGVAGAVPAGALLVYDISKSDALSGLAQTFAVTGAALMAIPLARLTAKGGRRLAVGVGYSIAALGAFMAVAGGTMRFLPLMLFGTMCAGAGSAAAYQLRFAAVDLSLPEHRGRDLSIVMWAGTVGSVLGPNLLDWSGGNAKALGLPTLVGPYLFSGTCLLFALAILLTFLRPDPYLFAVKLEGREKPHAQRSLRHAITLVRGSQSAQLALVAIVAGHIAMVSIMVMTPVHMKHYDATLRIIGLVISVHILGMYALSPVMGLLSDKWGRVAVIRLGVVILLAAAAVAATANPHHSMQLGFGLFLLGLGWSATIVAGSTLLSESVAVEDRPSIQGASDLFMNGSGAIGGALAGVIIATLGYAWLCLLAALPVLYLGRLTLKPLSK